MIRAICMGLDVSGLVGTLQKSQLVAECPECGDEFMLSDSLLFDGRKNFPEKAEIIKNAMIQYLENSKKDIENQQDKLKVEPGNRAISVGIGKNLEKMLPVHKNFSMNVPDCRFLADPIDMIVFHGLMNNNIEKITFMEIKTRKSTLNTRQRQIRDAVKDHKVKWSAF